MKASASRGGVRLLAACAALNLTLAAIGWLWQGRYVASALVDALARGAALSIDSFDWNALHVVFWWVWVSGWFAFVAARGQSDKAQGPDLHRPAMTVAAAGGAASLMWLWALWDVAQRFWSIDAERLASASAAAGMLRWTWLPLGIGAGAAIVIALLLLRWPFPDQRAGDVSPPRDAKDPADAKRADAQPQSAVRTLQLGLAVISLAAFGLFGQFILFGPAETTWSLDRLFSGPAAEGWAALTFLVVAHVAHLASGALTVLDRGDTLQVEPKASNADVDEPRDSVEDEPPADPP